MNVLKGCVNIEKLEKQLNEIGFSLISFDDLGNEKIPSLLQLFEEFVKKVKRFALNFPTCLFE